MSIVFSLADNETRFAADRCRGMNTKVWFIFLTPNLQKKVSHKSRFVQKHEIFWSAIEPKVPYKSNDKNDKTMIMWQKYGRLLIAKSHVLGDQFQFQNLPQNLNTLPFKYLSK